MELAVNLNHSLKDQKPMQVNNQIIINDCEEMKNFAQNIASKISENSIFMLFGTLGVGKSFFARSLIQSLLDKKTEVPSPTFNLIYQYQNQHGKIKNIFHFDLYRLYQSKTENLNLYQELENIGLFSSINQGLVLIEWPEIAESLISNDSYKLYFEFNENDQKNDQKNENSRRIILNHEFAKKFL